MRYLRGDLCPPMTIWTEKFIEMFWRRWLFIPHILVIWMELTDQLIDQNSRKKCEYLFTVSDTCLVSLMVSIAVGVQWQSKYPLLNIVNSSAKRDTSPRVHGIFHKCDIWTNKAFLYLNDFSDLVHDFDLE